MNYRHVYHAGNFADVLKHIVLMRVIEYLKKKPGAFRVIDTHAGVGIYDLDSEVANRTGEWRGGIARLYQARLEPDVAALVRPYLEAVSAENPSGDLTVYPGSPRLIWRLLRENDRLIANELHPEDHMRLKRLFARSPQVKVLGLDGWNVLKSVLPPKERRGVTIIDPPFEEPGEFTRIADGIVSHQRRFATGTLIVWFPIKDRRQVGNFYREIERLNLKSCLRCELSIDKVLQDGPVKATGLIIVNPPYTLYADLQRLLPALRITMGLSGSADFFLGWLSGESAHT